MRQTPADIAHRIYTMLTRAVIRKVDDTHLLQEQDIDMLLDEKRDGVEQFQFPFLTSVPHEENKIGIAEEVVACLGGDRTHMVALVVDDRRYRICGLQNGELMIHDEQGQQVHITRKGIVASVPHDRFMYFRVMKKDAGNPLEPMKEIQASKTSYKDDVLADHYFDRTTFTRTHRDKDKDKNGNEVNPTIIDRIIDKDAKVVTSMTMNKDGVTWFGDNFTFQTNKEFTVQSGQEITLTAGKDVTISGVKTVGLLSPNGTVFTIGETDLDGGGPVVLTATGSAIRVTARS